MARFAFVLLTVALINQADSFARKAVGCTTSEGQTNCKPCVRAGTDGQGRLVENKWPRVISLDLDKTELKIKENPEPENPPPFDPDLVVGVTVRAEDPEGDVLTYRYSVSGGRIAGAGPNVQWNLNGLRPGTYTITAGVDDGCGVCAKTITQMVTIAEAGQ